MSTIVYTLLSHRGDMLQAQLKMIRENMNDVSRIVAVQGPFGTNPWISAGTKMMTPVKAEELGIELLTGAQVVGGFQISHRVPLLINQCIEHALAQPERFMAVFHGDLVPYLKTDARVLLSDFEVAARGAAMPEGQRIWPTWFALDTEAPRAQKTRLHRFYLVGGAASKLWRAHQATQFTHELPDSLQTLPQLATYRYEWCEPTLLHLNQMTVVDDDANAHKLDGLEEASGVSLPRGDVCVEIVNTGDLPFFRPKRIGPMARTPVKSAKLSSNYVTKFVLAMQNWVTAGTPERNDEERIYIYNECCLKCPNLVDNTCTSCGSSVRGDEPGVTSRLTQVSDKPILNKIRMATEHCPIWQW